MPDENKKLYKPSMKGTGTVPKVKQRYNNNSEEHFTANVLSNNLGRERERTIAESNRQYRNLQYLPFCTIMDANSEASSSRQNSIINLTNGVTSPSNCHSPQQNLGFAAKCDNVAKYPDKKQIENKLSQIREYLQVVSSLRANIKNTDEQVMPSNHDEDSKDYDQLDEMIKDLRDSEAKLITILNELNEQPQYSENDDMEEPCMSKKTIEVATENLQMLKEQEAMLLHLQLSAENQLREARLAHAKLEKSSVRNLEREHVEATRNYDIRDLQEHLKSINVEDIRTVKQNAPSDVQNQIDFLQSHINHIREGGDNRNHLVEVLDHRNAQLQAENLTLQGKLHELQSKKRQMDELASQLQNMNEEEDDDMGTQVKRIINMKEHLAKLKDMLNIVQNTENTLDSQNVIDDEIEEHIHRLCAKTDNVMIQNRVPHVENTPHSYRHEINGSLSASSTNERHVKEKQVNKKSVNANERERLKIQAELRAKKKELEELMSKHNAATSNLNQDVQSDNKSDIGACGVNPVLDNSSNAWYPVDTNLFNLPQTSEQYSSDDGAEDDTNEYSEIHSCGELNGNPIVSMPSMNYPTTNYVKRLPEPEVNVDVAHDSYLTVSSRSPARSVRSATPAYPGRDNEATKNQLQKQLELIKSVCDSMLDGSNGTSSSQPSVQVRNNLTPSPIYSDPRQYGSPRPNPANALNVLNSNEYGAPPPTSFAPNDTSNYQNWLTTNALQTQGFILNTLNQCCQMLWLQQKEMASMKNTMATMQERCPAFDPHASSLYMNTCPFSQNHNAAIPNSQNNNHYRAQSKTNHPAAAGASSMPNLNGPCGHTNMEHVCVGHCNLQNGRILDNSLNNGVHHHQNMIGEHVNNLPWNGQALNNQVPPGNRANNYWDNFRSYSRQNLLSSKSNHEGLQNSCYVNQRSNNSSERSQPSSASHTGPKLNTDNQEASSATSVENTPKRVKLPRRRCNSITIASQQNQADTALNIGGQNKNNENAVGYNPDIMASNSSLSTSYNPIASTDNEICSDNPRTGKDQEAGHRRNRNEWIDDNGCTENTSEKSKLFEELRENVYKEVASLISANQGRPHFLIQLFRDLQLISSDPLRRRTLQSIQSVITNSLSNPANATGARRQDATPVNEEVPPLDMFPNQNGFVEMPSGIWSLKREDDAEEIIDGASTINHQEQCPELLTFLNSHDEDIFSDSLVHSLRDTLMHSTFAAVFANGPTKDGLIQKHFASLLTEALEQFRGQKVHDVRQNVVKTVENLQRGEISLIRLMRENIGDNEIAMVDSTSLLPFPSGLNVARMDELPQMQNGDLAEADQSCIDVEDDEEGAVGGVNYILLERNSQVLLDEDILPSVVECDSNEITEQGLDQVPTRLTNPSSRSNTPNKSL